MVSQQLKREIVIEAPPEIVWDAVTEPDQIALWFSDGAEFDLRPGGAGSLTWHPGGRATEDLTEAMVIPVQVIEVDPPRHFSFRWTHPEGTETTEGNSLLVEFTLTPEGDTTRLSVVESGFQDVDRDTDAQMQGHGDGWKVHLESLRRYATGKATAL